MGCSSKKKSEEAEAAEGKKEMKNILSREKLHDVKGKLGFGTMELTDKDNDDFTMYYNHDDDKEASEIQASSSSSPAVKSKEHQNRFSYNHGSIHFGLPGQKKIKTDKSVDSLSAFNSAQRRKYAILHPDSSSEGESSPEVLTR